MPGKGAELGKKVGPRRKRLGITQREAAEYLGVSAPTIKRRIEAGEIPVFSDGSIDPKALFRGDTTAHEHGAASTAEGDKYTRAYWEGVNAEAKAKMSMLQYEEAAGNYVEIATIDPQIFEMVRLTRDRILAVPDRICDVLAYEDDAGRCRQIMLRELRQALETLADSIEALPEREEDWE